MGMAGCRSQSQTHMTEELENGFTINAWQVIPHANSLICPETGRRRRVSSKAMQVMVLLASNAGSFVSKDQFLATVWADRVVTEDVLSGAVRALRRTLGDDSRNPRFIETRKGTGYRLIAEVVPRAAARRNRMAVYVGLAASLLIALVLPLLALTMLTRESAAPPVPTIAVLPFDTLSGAATEPYLASAMTDALILNLAERNRLRIISRTSVLPYATQQKSLQSIATELNADFIVEGSVITSGDRLRVSAQLVDGRSDTNVWAARYDRRLDDVLDIQADVAEQIARNVIGAVTDAPGRAAPALTGEALQTLLRARYLLAQERVGPVREALLLFGELAHSFPDVADGHLGQAEAQLQLFKSYEANSTALQLAETAARRALELDPRRSETFRCLAQVVQFLNWDLHGAEALYQRAIEINPSDTSARRRYAWLLVALQRYDRAMLQIDQIRLLDPSYYTSADGALLLMFAGDPHGAVAELERLNRETPSSVRTLRILSTAYWAVGRHDESVATLIESRIAAGNSPVELRAAFAAEGRDGVYRYLLDNKVFRAPVSQAALYAQMGDEEAALEWLERALSDRDPDLLFVKERPELAELRDHPRFLALVEQVSGSN